MEATYLPEEQPRQRLVPVGLELPLRRFTALEHPRSRCPHVRGEPPYHIEEIPLLRFRDLFTGKVDVLPTSRVNRTVEEGTPVYGERCYLCFAVDVAPDLTSILTGDNEWTEGGVGTLLGRPEDGPKPSPSRFCNCAFQSLRSTRTKGDVGRRHVYLYKEGTTMTPLPLGFDSSFECPPK